MSRFTDGDMDGGEIWFRACKWEEVGPPVTEALTRIGGECCGGLCVGNRGQSRHPYGEGTPEDNSRPWNWKGS